ncbi:serine hydrolase domain-containing protein [Ideonella sp. DXS29W]|uniref:Serine hydrolase domain-containing protein n=1 Tax=Ideonella lacteola TaxID=2984193 RepID=A0ABU9BUE6_9BURK
MTAAPPLFLHRFDTAVAALREQHAADGPGFSAALLWDGQLQRVAHHGVAHLEWPQPLAGDTRFYLASESKPWVAALVLDAVAAGRMALDADMRPWLPALSGCDAPVRLGHLLRHTSGIDDYLYLWHMQLGHDEDDLVTQAQALALIQRAGDVDFEPGARHDYSNSNYVLLADWLERDTGVSLDELARRRFFAPWGMADSSFERDPRRAMPRRARSYGRDAAGHWRERPVHLATWGDGGLWSTLDDVVRAEVRWLDEWRREGPRSLAARCGEDDPRFAPPGHTYRFGVEQLTHAGRTMWFHGGAFAGFTALVLRCLDEGMALVLLSNLEGFDASATTWTQRLWPAAGESG